MIEENLCTKEKTMANRCRICGYWRVCNEPHFFMWDVVGYGECTHSKVAYCGDGEARALAAEGNNDMLIYCHGGDWYVGASLVVGPDFGCIHFKPKEIKE